jgi:hypothetical protein
MTRKSLDLMHERWEYEMEDDDGRIQEGMMTMTGNNFIGMRSVSRICGAVDQ